MTFRFHLDFRSYGAGYSLAIIEKRRDGARAFLQPFIWKSVGEGFTIPESEAYALRDDYDQDKVREFLQAAADAAWEIGIKPKQMADHSSELKATKYHLEDMRKLAFEGSPISSTLELRESR